MRNPIIYLTAMLLLALTGCSGENTTEPVEDLGISGYIMDIGDAGILVVSTEPKDYSGTGGNKEFYEAVWASGETDDIKVGDYVEVQFKGAINDSYPSQADVGEIEVIPGSIPEGATLSDSEALNKVLISDAFGNEVLTVASIEFNAERDEWSIVLKNTDSYEELLITVDDK